jgi:hypothetical protein
MGIEKVLANLLSGKKIEKLNKYFFLIAWAALFFLPLKSQAGAVSLNPVEIAQLRMLISTNSGAAAQYAKIREAANLALEDEPAPIRKIVSEGHLASDPRKIRSWEALPDIDKTEALAWTWAVTGDERYAAQAMKFLLAWARVNEPDGDPINETKFEPMIVAYDLLRPGISGTDRETVDDWLRAKAETLLTKGKPEINNWASHRLQVIGLVGLALDDKSLNQQAVEGFGKHVAEDLYPDGSSLDFHTRDALHYHLYTVEPMLVLARAEARQDTNLDLFDQPAPGGASLHGSVDFVVPFAEGEKTHLEFAHSKVPFDRRRAEDGENEYRPHEWAPGSSIEMFSEADWFLPKYGRLAARLAGKPEETFVNWQMVINAVSRR